MAGLAGCDLCLSRRGPGLVLASRSGKRGGLGPLIHDIAIRRLRREDSTVLQQSTGNQLLTAVAITGTGFYSRLLTAEAITGSLEWRCMKNGEISMHLVGTITLLRPRP